MARQKVCKRGRDDTKMKVNKQSPTLHFLIATAETTNKLSLRMKTALGHYKLDNSFPSSARMPFMSQPNWGERERAPH